MEPKNGGLEDEFPFQLGDFLVPCTFFRGVHSLKLDLEPQKVPSWKRKYTDPPKKTKHWDLCPKNVRILMVTIASLGGGASRNRSTFLRQVTTVPLLGNLLFPSIMCLLVAPRKKLSAASIKHYPVLVPQIIPRDWLCFGQLGKKYFHEDGFAFPKCFPDCWRTVWFNWLSCWWFRDLAKHN